jgi:hypothetical protein
MKPYWPMGNFSLKIFPPFSAARRFDGAILTVEINDNTVSGRPAALHFDERASAAGQITFHRKSEHFDPACLERL